MSGPPHDAETPLSLERLSGSWAVCRLEPDATVPEWTAGAVRSGRNSAFLSITRTDRELSIVAAESLLPAETVAERDWAMFRVAGTLPFNLVGILARLTDILAAQRIPVFVISTHDTDYLLVHHADADRAQAALSQIATIIDLRDGAERRRSD